MEVNSMTNNTSLKMRPYFYGFCVGLITVLLSACGNGSLSDLQAYVADIKNTANPPVEALPPIPPVFIHIYDPEGKPDPFLPWTGTEPPPSTGPTGGGNEPRCPTPEWVYWVRTGLGLIPLDALQMVGTIQVAEKDQNNSLWGLVTSKSDRIIYQVRQGDYMGENYGKIINISETEIEVLQQFRNSKRCWDSKVTTLPLLNPP
jgi:type IV pilus assembly protein PilP